MAERQPKKNTSLGRHDRIKERMVERIDQTSGGASGVCAICGTPFDQIYRPEKQIYTQFKTCPECRMANARGYVSAAIPYRPHVNQIPIHESTARFKLLAAGSRFGKDRCMVNEFVRKFCEMLSEERGPELIPAVHGWIIAPTFPLARQVWRELKTFFPKQWILNVWESDKMIATINDGVIEVRSADDAENLVGVGLDIVLVTEAARIKFFDEVWANLESRLLSPGRGPNGTGGLGLINGTPRGRTFYYDMFRWGQKGDPEYDPLWESWHYTSWDNPLLAAKDKQVLDSIKKRYPDRIYRQEIMAEFLAEGNSVFPNADLCAIYNGPEEPEPGEEYVIGWDPAASLDFSGVVVRNSKGHVVYIAQWRGMGWMAQYDRIEFLAKYYNNALVILDKTGLGETLPETMIRRGVEIEPVHFTNLIKEDMVNNLAMLIDQKLISYPKNDVLLAELKDYEYTTTKTGKITYSASTQRKHDDLVTALMLAFKGYVISEIVLPYMGLLAGVNTNGARKPERETYTKNTNTEDDFDELARPDDMMLSICIRQGYVPRNCQLPGDWVWQLIQKEDPCAGCNGNRAVCGGRPQKYTYSDVVKGTA